MPNNLSLVQGYFDFIIDTVSAPHDYNEYLGLLKTNGVLICVGAPPAPAQIYAFQLDRWKEKYRRVFDWRSCRKLRKCWTIVQNIKLYRILN